MSNFIGFKFQKIIRCICLLLVIVLITQFLPLSVIEENTKERMHNGYLVLFDSSENRIAFEKRVGGERITDRLTLVRGVIIPDLI